jgi:Divergent InlB B-repeat domain
MRFGTARRAGVLFALVAAAVMLPGVGQSHIPPESDGSTYTWLGAATLNVDVKPWGGGYVRSTPYLIDCPLACIRPLEQGREITLTAHTTPGHTFESWEGACAGQGNPCTLRASGGLIDVRAVFSGQFVPPTPPPAPPAPQTPPAAVSPSLTHETDGVSTTFTGTGFNPNSEVTLALAWSTPPDWSLDLGVVATTDASGSWSYAYTEDCVFGESYSGDVAFEATAMDAGGASASTSVTGTCP